MATIDTSLEERNIDSNVASGSLLPSDVRKLISAIANEADIQHAVSSIVEELDDVESQLIKHVDSNSDKFYNAIADMENIAKRTVSLADEVTKVEAAICSADAYLESDSAAAKDVICEESATKDAIGMLNDIIDVLNKERQVRAMLDAHQFQDSYKCVTKILQTIDTNLAGIQSIQPIRQELLEIKCALEKMQVAHGNL